MSCLEGSKELTKGIGKLYSTSSRGHREQERHLAKNRSHDKYGCNAYARTFGFAKRPPFSSFLALLSARVSVTFMRLMLVGNSMQNTKRFSVEFYR